jgi:hypothetical protein
MTFNAERLCGLVLRFTKAVNTLMLKAGFTDGKRLRRRSLDFGVLVFLNFLFALNYLFSPSNQMLGFPYRQDAYWYMIVSKHLFELAKSGIVPFGLTWLRHTYCGIPEVVFIDPLYIIYLLGVTLTNNYVLAWKLATFFFYVLSSVAMYYLTHVLVKDRTACLVSAVAYTFTQVLVFEMFQGHLSMVAGFALIPLTVAFYVKAVRTHSVTSTALSAVFLAIVAIMRPDFAYFTVAFLIMLSAYFLLRSPNRLKTLLNFALLLLTTFLLAYPFLEPRYLSKFGELTENIGKYSYQFYSPELVSPFIPFMSSQGAYLGVSVLFFALIAGSASLAKVIRLRRKSSENDGLFTFILIAALLSFAVGLGSSGPLYGFLNQYAPYFQVFRVPTRWFVITALCLALLAGIGAKILLSQVKGRNLQRFVKVAVLISVFLDLSIFVAPTVYAQNGWRPIINYSPDYALYMFPQTSNVPEENMAYEYVSLDTGNSFRILSAPTVYSTSYYQLVNYFKETDTTFADNYVQFPQRSQLQTQVYNGFRYGNFSQAIGEQMALLGVKYLVYNYFWGEWQSLVAKMNKTQDLKFLLADNGYILYRNLRFGDVATNENLINNSDFENGDAEWAPWHVNGGVSGIDPAVSHLGSGSMNLMNSVPDGTAGRTQIVNIDESETQEEFKLSAWCKTENVTGENPSCAVRATLVYDDDSYYDSVCVNFPSGTHDWVYSSMYFSLEPQKTLKNIVVSFFLRNATGTAWFDNIDLTEEKPTDAWSGGFMVKEPYSDPDTVLSEENKANATLDLERKDPLTLTLRIRTDEPCYAILSESYDDGWHIHEENSTEPLIIQEYNSLILIRIPDAGTYNLDLRFTSYNESLNRIMLFSSGAFCLIALSYVLKRSWKLARATIVRVGRFSRG